MKTGNLCKEINKSIWRGGIGIAFGSPAKKIPDVTELGYEIIWGDEDLICAKILEIALFRYMGCGVNVNLKSPTLYDFSQMKDKEKAAKLAFDAHAERVYGVKGLSKHVKVKYNPNNCYGDVEGTMDLSSDNPLVRAIINTYLQWFKDNRIIHGGIALDGGGMLPNYFLDTLKRELNANGLGIASNGSPGRILPYINLAGDEVFPFTIPYVRDIKKKGLNPILVEFTTQHLSAEELESYLKTKLLNGIVFFGYTGGSVAASSQYSKYARRPDVYNHHRWVLRKYIPLSRAIVSAGLQLEPYAYFESYKTQNIPTSENVYTHTNEQGVVIEYDFDNPININEMINSATGGLKDIVRYGNDIKNGIYLYVNSRTGEDVKCAIKNLRIKKDTIVFDEFNKKIIRSKLTRDYLEFTTSEGPALVQLGGKATIVKNILSRIGEILRQQLLQRKMEKEVKLDQPLKPWAPFCQGWSLDKNVFRTGNASMKVVGGTYASANSVYTYYNRQGAAQFVSLNQGNPIKVTLSAYSKSEKVPKSELETIADRRLYFKCREAFVYCLHLYIDYQDGIWPEIYTVRFSPGTHDWERKTVEFTPKKPIKTIMILLEFQQPEGVAWFDDISLTQATEPNNNLLDYPGFESDNIINGEIAAINNDYEKKLNIFLKLFKATQKKITKPKLSALKKETESTTKWLNNVKYGHCLGRESRDFDDVKEKISLCLELLQ